jgi:hypothetical protein
MKKNLILILAIAFLILSFSFAFLINSFTSSMSSVPSSSDMSLKYTGVVCVGVNGPAVNCKHNLFTNMGANLTRQALINGVNGVITNYIGLGNSSTTQAATDVALASEMGAGCDLGRAQGTISNVTTGCASATCPGNWTISRLFTYSGSCSGVVRVNATGLYQGASGNNLFAENTFTNADLSPNDQINITWFIWVTGS